MAVLTSNAFFWVVGSGGRSLFHNKGDRYLYLLGRGRDVPKGPGFLAFLPSGAGVGLVTIFRCFASRDLHPLFPISHTPSRNGLMCCCVPAMGFFMVLAFSSDLEKLMPSEQGCCKSEIVGWFFPVGSLQSSSDNGSVDSSCKIKGHDEKLRMWQCGLRLWPMYLKGSNSFCSYGRIRLQALLLAVDFWLVRLFSTSCSQWG